MGVEKRDGSGGEDGSLVFEVWIFHWRQVIPRTGAETQATANGAHQIQRSGLNPEFRISPDSFYFIQIRKQSSLKDSVNFLN
jgi:hypothetical protein